MEEKEVLLILVITLGLLFVSHPAATGNSINGYGWLDWAQNIFGGGESAPVSPQPTEGLSPISPQGGTSMPIGPASQPVGPSPVGPVSAPTPTTTSPSTSPSPSNAPTAPSTTSTTSTSTTSPSTTSSSTNTKMTEDLKKVADGTATSKELADDCEGALKSSGMLPLGLPLSGLDGGVGFGTPIGGGSLDTSGFKFSGSLGSAVKEGWLDWTSTNGYGVGCGASYDPGLADPKDPTSGYTLKIRINIPIG